MGFLEDYKIYTESLEVPEIFHTWCAFSALSAVAQRKVWLDMGHFKLAPNLYVCLTAPPGKCGKGTAMNIVRELLDNTEGVKIKSDSITKEKIFDAMEKAYARFEFPNDRTRVWGHSSLTIFADEMSLLIKKGDKDFVSALCTLYNTMPTFRHSTKTSGENIVVLPYLNILGGTTPEWISNNIHEDIIEGGLSARVIFVYSNKPKPPNPNPSLSQAARTCQQRVLLRLNQLVGIGGEVRMTTEARAFYDEWYIKHHSQEPTKHAMMGYHYRKRVHLLKLATLINLADSNGLTIQPDDLQVGLNVLELTEPLIEKSLEGVGRNILNPIALEILDWIGKSDKVKMATIWEMNAHRLNLQEFKDVIASLVMAKKIDELIDENGTQWVRAKVQGGKGEGQEAK